jgi:hypothetical protein
MKRTAICLLLLLALVCAGIGRAAYQAAAPSVTPLSKYVPAGPLLYLEAKDFSALLADWNSSPQKKQWVESSNYQVFSRSRLFLRLHGAGDQFAAAAGLPPDMNFLSQVAGTRSAVALYDIGNLQFLYITYLPSAKSMQTTLWQTRAKFEPRSAGGVNFYVRRDPESQKEVAFAVSGDYLLLATREDLLAGALQLMSGSQNRTVESEQWWAQSVAAAGALGDLRMVLNLEKIVPSPYFRTYWVQQNITDLTQYSAAVSDLFRSDRQYREERVLIREAPPTAASSADGLEAAADLVRLAPDSAGVYEAKATPSTDSCLDLLETKLLAPHLGPAPPSQIAPQVQLTSGETGGASDLETRIDQPAIQRPITPQSATALKELLDKTQLLASLQVQSTERDRAGVFVRIRSAVVLAASSDWNEASVQSALAEFVRPSLTASQFGVTWQQKSGYHDSSYYELDGLWPLVASVRSKYLMVSDDPNLIAAMLSNFSRKSDVKPAVFVAGLNHSRERANFARFAGVVDRPNLAQSNVPGMGGPGMGVLSERQPQFFSENMASLSSTLADVSTERITVRPEGDRILQTVTYEWSQ